MDLITIGSAGILIGATYAILKINRGKQKTDLSETKQVEPIKYIFSKSGESPQKLINQVIDNTKSTLDIAVYTITETDIMVHLSSATNRGVKVRIITDRRQSKNPLSAKALERLKNVGIPIKVNNYDGLMHLKEMIADKNIVVTGSYNYTYSAEKKNEEVIIILKEKELVKEWSEKFHSMWEDGECYQNLGGDFYEKYA